MGILIIFFRHLFRPPRGAGKVNPVLSDEDEEEDPELLEAKIILSDVATSGRSTQYLYRNTYVPKKKNNNYNLF